MPTQAIALVQNILQHSRIIIRDLEKLFKLKKNSFQQDLMDFLFTLAE